MFLMYEKNKPYTSYAHTDIIQWNEFFSLGHAQIAG